MTPGAAREVYGVPVASGHRAPVTPTPVFADRAVTLPYVDGQAETPVSHRVPSRGQAVRSRRRQSAVSGQSDENSVVAAIADGTAARSCAA